MNIDIKKILYCILLIAIQLLLDNYLDLGIYIYLFIVPYFILFLPYRYKTIPTMFLAFFAGLAIDFLSNGVLGLNAGALTTMALFRQSFMQLVVNEQSMDKYETPTLKDMGILRYSLFVLLSYLVFFITFSLLDNFGSGMVLISILKTIISSISNTVLIVIISFIIQERR